MKRGRIRAVCAAVMIAAGLAAAGSFATAAEEAYVEFDRPVGINLALDTTKEISIRVQGESGWVNFAFLTECSNGGFAQNGSRGTGFSFMTWDYGGLKLDFVAMDNGIRTPAAASYFSAGAPNDGTGKPNADGVTVAANAAFTFTIRPVNGSFEFLLQGKKMTAYGTGEDFYESIKGSLPSFADAQGKTYLNATVLENKRGRILSVTNGDTVYSVTDILRAMNENPSDLATEEETPIYRDRVSAGQVARDGTVLYLTFPGFRGTQKLGLCGTEDVSGAEDFVSLHWEDEGTLRFVCGEKQTDFITSPREVMRLEIRQGKLYLQEREIADFSDAEAWDKDGRSFLWAEGVCRSDSINLLALSVPE